MPDNAPSHSTPSDNPLTAHDRLALERLKLATDVLLANHDDIPDTLEAELPLPRAPRARPTLTLSCRSAPRPCRDKVGYGV
jgi:hypothetical protein